MDAHESSRTNGETPYVQTEDSGDDHARVDGHLRAKKNSVTPQKLSSTP